MEQEQLEYVGFWARVGASLIDTILMGLILWPLLTTIYGAAYWTDSETLIKGPMDFLLSWVAPALAVIAFWIARQATPGKMAVGARIVDARTGGKPSAGVLKDVVMLASFQELEFDFVADNPGPTLFHCHQQLHVDFGFMCMFNYA